MMPSSTSLRQREHANAFIVKLLHDTKAFSAAADACTWQPVVEFDVLIGGRARTTW
jgi:hypothetical protein